MPVKLCVGLKLAKAYFNLSCDAAKSSVAFFYSFIEALSLSTTPP
jgi:hypothetical protein